MHYAIKKRILVELAELLNENAGTFPNFINFISKTNNEFKSEFFLTYAINNNFYGLDSVNQRSFWYIFFNFVNFPNKILILTPARRKMLKKKFSKPAYTKTKSLQNILKGLSKKGLIKGIENPYLACYHKQYELPTTFSNSTLNLKVTQLLDEIVKIKVNLYGRSLY